MYRRVDEMDRSSKPWHLRNYFYGDDLHASQAMTPPSSPTLDGQHVDCLVLERVPVETSLRIEGDSTA